MSFNPIIEHILDEHRTSLKDDYSTYKNHVYRVYHLCVKMDTQPAHTNKYAIASAFHDLAIWTHHTFDYLEPSVKQARTYLERIAKAEWKDEISCMIDMHHKMTRYAGQYEKTVETFRQADWMDVTMGLIHFKLDRREVSKLQQQFPLGGFHWFLIKQSVRNFLKHPLNPLPMFKK